MAYNNQSLRSILVVIAAVCFVVINFLDNTDSSLFLRNNNNGMNLHNDKQERRLQQQQHQKWENPANDFLTQEIRPYNYHDIEKTMSILFMHARILIFDGTNFHLLSVISKKSPLLAIFSSFVPTVARQSLIFPFLIASLKREFPDRFQPGQKPLQIMLDDNDAVNFGFFCTNDPQRCPTAMKDLPPFLQYGSVPTHFNDFPQVQAFPNWIYMQCLKKRQIYLEEETKNGNDNDKEEEPFFCDLPKHFHTKKLLNVAANAKKKNKNWNDLIPTIIWRGSDHAFLVHVYGEEFNDHRAGAKMIPHGILNNAETTTWTHQQMYDEVVSRYHRMTPRWRAVVMTIQADEELRKQKEEEEENPSNIKKKEKHQWIDARFWMNNVEWDGYHRTFNNYGVNVCAEQGGMSAERQARYKYHLDLGGGGGTTWTGTLTKLVMPGVLFHHETLMKDWYMDLLKPWVHYIPVSADLHDLRERYEWAEANPDRCQEMSAKATELVQYLLSEAYIDKLYQYLFKDYMKRVVDAYEPTPEELALSTTTTGPSQLLKHYKDLYEGDGFDVTIGYQCKGLDCVEEKEILHHDLDEVGSQ